MPPRPQVLNFFSGFSAVATRSVALGRTAYRHEPGDIPVVRSDRVTFSLVAYELQVASEWTALQAGTALLPAALLMFAVSA
jgi:hypothetical protein